MKTLLWMQRGLRGSGIPVVAGLFVLLGSPAALWAVDTSSPTVRLTEPLNRAVLSGTVVIKTTATDNVGVARVEFYRAGVLQHTAVAPPFSWTWNTKDAPNILWRIIARAYDAAGNAAPSGAMDYQVSNAVPVVGDFFDDFEAGDFSKWPGAALDEGAHIAVAGAAAYEGTKGLQIRLTGQDDATLTTPIEPSEQLYARVRFRTLDDFPANASADHLLTFGVTGLSIHTKDDYLNRFFLETAGGRVDTKVSAAPNRWYTLELFTRLDPKGVKAVVRIDGVEKASKTFENATPFLTSLAVGANGTNANIEYHLDDVATSANVWVGTGPFTRDPGPRRSGGAPSGALPELSTSAELKVTTDRSAVCRAGMDPSAAFDALLLLMAGAGGTSHSKTVTGISVGNTYEYFVRCQDAAGTANTTPYRIGFYTAVDRTTAGPVWLAATYESISVYTSFSGDANANNGAVLEYRKAGDGTWRRGMDMSADRRAMVPVGGPLQPNPAPNQHRASVLGVTPDTVYEVRVTHTDPDGVLGANPLVQTIRTRSDAYPAGGSVYYVDDGGDDANPGTLAAPFRTVQKAAGLLSPGDKAVVRAGTYPGRVDIARSGTAAAYIHVEAYPGETPVIDASAAPALCGNGVGYSAQCGVLITGSYVRFSGFEIVNGMLAVKVAPPARDVIVEKIRTRGQIANPRGDSYNTVVLIGNSGNPQNSVANITVQDMDILTNAPDLGNNIILVYGASGGHVIRRNLVVDTHPGVRGVHGVDCIGGMLNKAIHGGFFKDTDVNDNVCVGATDEGIEVDGGNMNVRVWNNRVSRTNLGVSVAPVILGPVYVFRNVFYDLEAKWSGGCVGIKEGEDGTGDVFFYHNTFHVADGSKCDKGSSNALAPNGSGASSTNLVLRNNIFHGADRSMSSFHRDDFPDLDYNVHFDENGLADNIILKYTDVPYNNFGVFVSSTGQEQHGHYGRPSYVDEAGKDFRLAAGSLGVDQGVVIRGFNDADSPWPYRGAAPDIGAYELGDGPVVDRTPPSISAVAVADVGASSATVRWITDEPADAQVEFGPTAAYGTLSPLAPAREASHGIALTGLAAGRTYHFRVRSKDAAGNAAVSGDFVFTTRGGSDAKPGDINGDGFVTLIDLSLLLGKWGTFDATCDIVANGVVDIADLSRLLAHWDAAVPAAQSFGAPALRPRGGAPFRLSPRARRASSNPVVVDLFVDAPRPVNAVQAALSFPAEGLRLQAVETADSAFDIAAQESAAPGTVVLARASRTPLAGRLRVARLIFEAAEDVSGALSFARNSMALSAADASDMAAAAESVVLSGRPASLTFLTPAPADGVNDAVICDEGVVAVTITDVTGRRVYEGESRGGEALRWDGRDSGGKTVPSGGYIARLRKADGAVTYKSLVVAK